MPKFYITTAIDYVNNVPHLGTAYEKIAADALARYKRIAGFDTRFLMGNDEHSTNVEKAAREKGLEPEGLLRPDGRHVPGCLEAPRHLLRRFHPHDRAAAQPGVAGALREDRGAG
jgi:methionyl-tRNA synthetase